MFSFHITAAHPNLNGLSVVRRDDTPSVLYYGYVVLSRDIYDHDAEARGLYRKSDASAETERDADALYNAEMRAGA